MSGAGGHGSIPHGAGAEGSSPSVSLVYIPTNGGVQVTVTGAESAGKFIVHVGPKGDASDPVAYPGIPGAGSAATFTDVGGEFGATVWMPPLPVGGPYQVFLEGVDLPGALIGFYVQAIPQTFKSKVFALRGVLPHFYATGSKSLQYERFPQ